MFEATEIPDIFRCNLDKYDTVLVPSKQNVEMFGRHHPNVRQVPLGIDADVWFYRDRKDPGMWFNFFHPAMGPRKGTDVTLAAFEKAFPGREWESLDPLPRLIFKTPRVIGRDVNPSDRVQVFTGRLSIEDEVAMYADAHCVLAPSRGEGWGMQPLQAIAQGCPTILTAAHGHLEFSHLGYEIGYTMMPAHYSLFGDCGFHWDPNVDELAEAMRWVYDNYGQAKLDAMHASASAHEQFTWRNTAQRFVEAVGLSEDPPQFERGVWKASDHRVEMVTTKNLEPSIGGINYDFKAGETYLVPPDVKRVLTNAGFVEKGRA
jgi:glycosyltransferase involved in cell wall biosynthesis